jgi:transposase
MNPKPNAPEDFNAPLHAPCAETGTTSLTSYTIGALPLIDRLFERMRVRHFVHTYLPHVRKRSQIPIEDTLLVLVKNCLLAREPLYSLGEWAMVHDHAALGLEPDQVSLLNDDRVGRALARLFDADQGSMALALVSHIVKEFGVSLDELHNDSTTVTFHGAYARSGPGKLIRTKVAPHITYGHNKDHRPDLKQLLYVLTTTRDGCIPVHFRTFDGNTPDDLTHWETWQILRQLRGSADFLYIADSKLASTENLTRIHGAGGRFISVLPRTRSEDRDFRERLQSDRVRWSFLWQRQVEDSQALIDEIEVAEEGRTETLPEGFRLLWFRSSAKAQRDAEVRANKMNRAKNALVELNDKLRLPKTRWRDRKSIELAVAAILEESEVSELSAATVLEYEEEQFEAMTRGRRGPETPYRRTTQPRFELAILWNHERVDAAAREDGVFPLITNEAQRSPLETLFAYKRQPALEKRFSQFKTDFEVAPVYLKNVDRVQALLCVYFIALLTQALLERELRNNLDLRDDAMLPLYPEGRECRRPCARRVFDLFGSVQRHVLRQEAAHPTQLVTSLSPLQRRLIKMLAVGEEAYRPR